jgi:hypothetical protein
LLGLAYFLLSEKVEFRHLLQYENQQDKLRSISAKLNNRSWYLKSKLTDGSDDDYSLDDYDNTKDYSPMGNESFAGTSNENAKREDVKNNSFSEDGAFHYTVR